MDNELFQKLKTPITDLSIGSMPLKRGLKKLGACNKNDAFDLPKSELDSGRLLSLDELDEFD